MKKVQIKEVLANLIAGGKLKHHDVLMSQDMGDADVGHHLIQLQGAASEYAFLILGRHTSTEGHIRCDGEYLSFVCGCCLGVTSHIKDERLEQSIMDGYWYNLAEQCRVNGIKHLVYRKAYTRDVLKQKGVQAHEAKGWAGRIKGNVWPKDPNSDYISFYEAFDPVR